MPTLGGLLKKRRKDTKGSRNIDPTTAAAAANSAPSSSATESGSSASVPTQPRIQTSNPQHSPAAVEGTNPASSGAALHPASAATDTSTDNSLAAATAATHLAAADTPSTASSEMPTVYQRPSPHTPGDIKSPGQPQSLHNSPNVASIKNIINPPQHEDQQHQQSQPQQQSQTHVTGESQVGAQTQGRRQLKGKYSLTDFTLRRTLGTGSFGRVHLVQSVHNQRYYAIKVLKKAQVVKMKQVEHTNDERSMLERVKHPFLVTLWGTFQDVKNLYMVMDFAEGGELFSLLRKSQVSMTPILVS